MNLINLTFLLTLSFLGEALEIPQAKKDILPSVESCGANDCAGFPWLVHIPLRSHMRYSNAEIRCAGTLISKRYVITYEACLQHVLNDVYIGQENLETNEGCDKQPAEKVRVESKVVGEEWNVALLRLERDVEFRNGVQPICLPFGNFKRSDIHGSVFTMGWGHRYIDEPMSNTSKKVSHKIISHEDCIKAGVIENDDSKVFCAMQDRYTNQYACYGDEGSPIITFMGGQFVLEGILTHASDGFGTICAIEKPIRGQRITEELLQWIIDHVEA